MKSKVTIKEVFFQIVLNAIVFIFYAYDRRGESFESYHFGFFLNYAIGALVINYIAFPFYYRTRKLWIFVAIILATVFAVISVEELFLEKIFFPSRGDNFMAWFAFLEIIPIIAILAGVKFGWDALTQQKEVEELKDAVKQSELQFLKSQINPHFLFNNLNNLYSYALEGSEKTPDIILELSGLLRYMLYECTDEFVLLRQEVDQLENFINLNKLQIEDRGNVSFEVNGVVESWELAPLILIVFVENAFKHSLASQTDGIRISIDLGVSATGELHFTCRNSFSRDSNNDNVAKGIGLKNVRKRLDLLYPKKHTLSIDSDENDYIVDLKLQLKKRQ